MDRTALRRILLEEGWAEDKYESFRKEITTPKGIVQSRRIKLMGLVMRCDVQIDVGGYKEWSRLGSAYYRDIELVTLPDGNKAFAAKKTKWLCRLHSAVV